MPRSFYQQNSFVSGVLEPRIYGRVDIQQYYQGLKQGDNVLILPQGGLRQRYGTVFMEELDGCGGSKRTRCLQVAYTRQSWKY